MLRLCSPATVSSNHTLPEIPEQRDFKSITEIKFSLSPSKGGI